VFDGFLLVSSAGLSTLYLFSKPTSCGYSAFYSRGPSSYLDPQRATLLEILRNFPLVKCLKFGHQSRL